MEINCSVDKALLTGAENDTDTESKAFEIVNSNGRYRTTAYYVFPGITLEYTDAHISVFESGEPNSENSIEITYCREGRMECNYGDEFIYLAAGDLLIARRNAKSAVTYFPLKHYHGISVRVDISLAPRCLSCFLDDVTVSPISLAEKFVGSKNCFAVRSEPAFEHIFSELYAVPTEIRKGYNKIKILELLLFLSALNVNKDELSEHTYSKSQVSLAKRASAYMIAHMEERLTLEQLAEQFHVSGTYIKNAFRGVYGVSPYSYIRTRKMESAAYMLEYTDKSILEIAGEHGYDNASKFAGAFRDVKGMSPNEYRAVNKTKA